MLQWLRSLGRFIAIALKLAILGPVARAGLLDEATKERVETLRAGFSQLVRRRLGAALRPLLELVRALERGVQAAHHRRGSGIDQEDVDRTPGEEAARSNLFQLIPCGGECPHISGAQQPFVAPCGLRCPHRPVA
jgi:hypothetical protein